MNYRGGCCITRYGSNGGGGGGPGGYNMSKVDRIMLRYRPIAPKPNSGGSSSQPEKDRSVLTNVSSKSRRGKRKSSKENSSSSGSINSNENSKRRKNESGFNGEIVTLSLIPETPEKKESSVTVTKTLLRDYGRYQMTAKKTDVTSELTEMIVSSLLTVECITERHVEEGEYELTCTDEERKIKLEIDTCPCFISDGSGRVIWTNDSFRDLVIGKDEKQCCCSKMSVWLVMKEEPLLTYRTFTCRMRLQYTCHDKDVSSITLFCDVWRMNDGGFAWRLDVSVALCLGR